MSNFAKQIGARMDESQELEGSLEDSEIDKQFNMSINMKIEDSPRKALTPKAKLNDYEKKPPLKSYGSKLN